MPTVADSPLLTAAEACRLLRCSARTLQRLRAAGRIRAVRHLESTRWLFFAEGIETYLHGLGLRAEVSVPARVRPRRRGRLSREEARRRAQAARATRGW